MFARLYLFVGIISLAVFTWAQYQGISPFDNTADTQQLHSSGHGSYGSGSYHK